jgi:SagB-type dehydrogenase family enzyme
MKRSFFSFLLLSASILAAQDVKLPAPDTKGGKPLMQALAARQSAREFSPEKLSPQTLANLLWAAWGVNRADGRRTAPSAVNYQEIEVYVLTADGAYVYDAKGNALKQVGKTDTRKQAGQQPFVAGAPVNLVYVADFAKMGSRDEMNKVAWSHADTGFIAENVYLFCASEGLGVVVRAMIDRDPLAKTLNLSPTQRITLSQTVGYVKK